MEWNNHFKLKGKHALLSASQPSWINYNDDRLLEYADNKKAAERGSLIHAWAAQAIELGFKQAVPRGKVKTVESYINDAIGFHMDCEVLLYYSDNIFGTADAISFRNGKLRIHDLKTGHGPVHDDQLVVYAALFCLEYRENPEDLREIELRIYQNDEITILEVTPQDIRKTMDTIVRFDELLRKRTS